MPDLSAAVAAVVLLEVATGGTALLALTPVGNDVSRSYHLLLAVVFTLTAAGAWAAMPPASAGANTLTATAAMTFLASASMVAFALHTRIGRILGLAASAAGLVALGSLATMGSASVGGAAAAFAELVLGAFVLGAVVNALVLGHWYLVDRKLPERHMRWMAAVNLSAAAGGVVSVLLALRRPPPCRPGETENCMGFAPLLPGDITVLFGVPLALFVLVIAIAIVRLAWQGGRAIQGATGMALLATMLAPGVELAAKLRFW